ncbi:MAG: hypothetical protein QM796_19545 [Chthoniobacteraceae bacterium]
MKHAARWLCAGLSILTITSLSGCAGYVGGELHNARSHQASPAFSAQNRDLAITCKCNAKNSLGGNPAGMITLFTIGLVPTAWITPVTSEATLSRNGTVVFKKKYYSLIHEYYGLLWLFILPEQSADALDGDENSGLHIAEGVRERTAWKVMGDYEKAVHSRITTGP